jgi:hypothetical protein
MDPTLQLILTIAGSVIVAFAASSGFWAFMMKRLDKKVEASKQDSNETKLLLGLAHDRIVSLGKEYLSREPKYITLEEYENLHDYLYVPYEASNGNGSAKKIMKCVEDTLPVTDQPYPCNNKEVCKP